MTLHYFASITHIRNAIENPEEDPTITTVTAVYSTFEGDYLVKDSI